MIKKEISKTEGNQNLLLRLQLFSPTGEFLTMYGFDSSNWKNFDSPRGVCFSAEDQVRLIRFYHYLIKV